MNIKLLLPLLLLALAACAAHLPRPTPMQAELASQRWPGSSLESLKQGRSLYAAKCSGCHVPHRPSQYPAEKWSKIVDEKADRANLSGEEQELILQYLLTVTKLP